MYIMKKLLLAMTIILSINSHAASLQSKSSEPILKIVTTFTIFADIAQQIAGDKANVVSITKAGAEIHNYQPTPKDILKTQGADLILWHGMNLELWFDKFYQNIKDVPKAVLTKGITPLSINGGEYTGKPNPHAWMSTSNAIIYIENIRLALTKIDPVNARYYQQNAKRYGEEVSSLALPYKQQILALPENHRWLVSSEGAFSYLARDLGLKELFIWPINADSQGSPQQMRHVIDQVNNIKYQLFSARAPFRTSPLGKSLERQTVIMQGFFTLTL